MEQLTVKLAPETAAALTIITRNHYHNNTSHAIRHAIENLIKSHTKATEHIL